MRNSAAYLAVCLLTLGLVRAGAATPALSAADAWMRATPGSDVAAVYLTVRNGGAEPVTILGVRSPFAQAAMIHETQLSGTQSRMRASGELTVQPGQTLQFAPGGLHVMLHMLRHAPTAGEEVPLVLLLKGGGTLVVTAQVRPLTQQ